MEKLSLILEVLWKLFWLLWGLADDETKATTKDLKELAEELSKKLK